MMMASNSFFSMAFTTVSVIPCAKIVKNHSVVSANQSNRLRGSALFVYDDNGFDEFITDAGFVARVQSSDGIGSTRFCFATHHRAVSEFDALPAIVAIHRVIASN